MAQYSLVPAWRRWPARKGHGRGLGYQESSELSHYFPRKKAKCSSLCSATHQLCDPVKVVLPLGISLLIFKVGWQW